MTRWLQCLSPACAVFLLLGSSRPSHSAPEICPLAEVRAGQVAVAKSVFRGTTIESFHVEIVGVVPKFDGTRSIIFGRILDGPVIARQSGVIGGMSGSPVYIDGRLAGAIAYAWPWSKEPLAGIQPIEEMLGAWRERPASVPARAARDEPHAPVLVGGSPVHEVRVATERPAEPDPPGVVTLVPLGGLVQVSGFNARALERLRETLAPYGLRIAAGGAGTRQDLRPPLEPGAALGATLVAGDFEMTALGTLTVREGDRVLGFGHPIFQRGDVDLPMTGGYVYDIMPSQYISNKIMSPTQTVGRVYSDYRSAIAGMIGGRADMMPVSVAVEAEDAGASGAYKIEVARLRELTPGLVASSVVTAIDEVRGYMARGTARVRVEIETEGRKLVRDDLAYSPADAAAAAVPMVLTPLAFLTDNPFGSRRVDRVSVTVQTTDTRKTAEIERVTLRQSRVEAGDEIELLVAVRPYGEAAVEMPMRLSLPEDLPQGRVRIIVSGGGDADQARNAIGAPRPSPVTIDQLLDRYLELESNSDLVVQAALPRAGVSILGEELPSLPQTSLEALRASNPTDMRPVPSVAKAVRATDWVLTGRQALTVEVASPVGRRGAPKPPGGAPEQPEEEANAFDLGSSRRAAGVEASAVPMGARRPPSNDEKKEEEEKPKALTREPERWTHSSGADYGKAKLDGILLAADGSLSLGLSRSDLGAIPADVVWTLVVREGTAYVGTGSQGKIFRVTDDGHVSEFFATGEMGVHALAFAPDGALYAGTSPRGRLFRISPEGQGEVIFDAESTYLWALAVSGDGSVYAGAGSPGRIYRVAPDGKGQVFAELPVANVLSLVCGRDGEIYAGTADTGVIYRIDSAGRVTTAGQVAGASVDALALDENGRLYASSSPGGEVFSITPGAEPELSLETGEPMIFGLALPTGRGLVAGTGGRGLVVQAGAGREPELVYEPERSRFATAIAADGGAIYVAHSGPCFLRRFGPGPAPVGTVESDVLDAERPAHWGRVTWQADLPEGATVTVQTRSGDSPTPGDHWSEWADTSDDVIMSPPARFLQYRLSLRSEPEGPVPVVRQISVSRRPQNQAPEVALRSPTAGDRLSGKAELKWQGRDPDKDTLSYSIEISPDLGATWKAVKESIGEPKYEWDTSEQEDGRYLLRVTASDRQSVPSDPETAEATALIWIDNSEPALLLFRNSLSVDEERRGHVAGMATDELSPLRSVEYRVGAGDWQSLPLTAVESMMSDISITTDPLEPGAHSVEARAFDAAGNVATDKVDLTVEGEPGEKGSDEMSAASVTTEDQAAKADAGGDEAEAGTGADDVDESSQSEQGEEGPAGSLAPAPAAPET